MQRAKTEQQAGADKQSDEVRKQTRLNKIVSVLALPFKKRKKRSEKTIYPLF